VGSCATEKKSHKFQAPLYQFEFEECGTTTKRFSEKKCNILPTFISAVHNMLLVYKKTGFNFGDYGLGCDIVYNLVQQGRSK
jgi:hypothetical protein